METIVWKIKSLHYIAHDQHANTINSFHFFAGSCGRPHTSWYRIPWSAISLQICVWRAAMTLDLPKSSQSLKRSKQCKQVQPHSRDWALDLQAANSKEHLSATCLTCFPVFPAGTLGFLQFCSFHSARSAWPRDATSTKHLTLLAWTTALPCSAGIIQYGWQNAAFQNWKVRFGKHPTTHADEHLHVGHSLEQSSSAANILRVIGKERLVQWRGTDNPSCLFAHHSCSTWLWPNVAWGLPKSGLTAVAASTSFAQAWVTRLSVGG